MNQFLRYQNTNLKKKYVDPKLARKISPIKCTGSNIYTWQRISYCIFLNKNLRIYGPVFEILEVKVAKTDEFGPILAYKTDPIISTRSKVLNMT